jgi:hypothetical protein
MNALQSNPIAYLIPTLLILGFGSYYLFGAMDRWGLPITQMNAVISGKQFTPAGATYNSVISGGRNWVQTNKTPDYYAISLLIDNEPALALVTQEKYNLLNIHDKVHVKVRRTRIRGRLEVIELIII